MTDYVNDYAECKSDLSSDVIYQFCSCLCNAYANNVGLLVNIFLSHFQKLMIAALTDKDSLRAVFVWHTTLCPAPTILYAL